MNIIDNCSALVTTVNHPQKIAWLPYVLDSIDKNVDVPFVKKIVSVDSIIDCEYPEQLVKLYKKTGWEFHFVNNKNRVKTLCEEMDGLSSTEYVLHAEDDIAIQWLPQRNTLNNILSHTFHDGRTCGILTPSIGGSTFKCEGGDDGDLYLFKLGTDIILKHPNYVVFRRREENRSQFFFELGTLFIKTSLFRDCLKLAANNLPGMQIEQALSTAYFFLGAEKSLYKATICKPHIEYVYEKYPQLVDPTCRFIDILDPDQGSSLYGVGHFT